MLSEDENDAKYEALREFVLETLGKFTCKLREVGIRLGNLERKVDSGTDCTRLKAHLDDIHRRIDKEVKPDMLNSLSTEIREVHSRIDQLEEGIRKSEVEGKQRKRKFMEDDESDQEEEEEEEMARSIDDLKENIRGKVSKVFDSLHYRKEKEKVSKLQLAYIHFWLGLQETNSPTKLVDIQNLIKDGIQDRIWRKDWKPDVKGDFSTYLQDKVKNIVKKKKALREKATLQKELENLVGDDF